MRHHSADVLIRAAPLSDAMSLDPAIADRIADVPLSAHLATSVDDRPHVAPVWYVYDEGELSVLTGGKKLANVRRNPRVALSIESYDASGVDWSVQLLGTASVVDDAGRVDAVQERLDEIYGDGYGTDGGEEETEGEDDWALVVVTVGSGSMQTY